MRKPIKKKKRRDQKTRRLRVLKQQAPTYHNTCSYLLEPQHPITVKVIGCGGSGSQMLQGLARIHVSLRALGHPGFAVQAWDPDKVTEANLGRQLFSVADLGQYKAKVLIERINRFYGLTWSAFPVLYGEKDIQNKSVANIIITCVDNVKVRRAIDGFASLVATQWRRLDPFTIPLYWLDLGNTRTMGQVVLGSFGPISQPKGARNTQPELPTIVKLVPDLEKHEEKNVAPSCSLAEALGKQDLFINSLLAQYGCDLIWKLFRELRIKYHGVYVNLETLTTNPITIKPTN